IAQQLLDIFGGRCGCFLRRLFWSRNPRAARRPSWIFPLTIHSYARIHPAAEAHLILKAATSPGHGTGNRGSASPPTPPAITLAASLRECKGACSLIPLVLACAPGPSALAGSSLLMRWLVMLI